MLIFAPCEKVILAQDNTISMVTVLEEIRVKIPSNKPVPPDGVFPMKWAVLTLWQGEEGDEHKEFEQKCDLMSEEGKKVLTASLRFGFPKPSNRAVMEILGFPLLEGRFRLKMFLRETNPVSDWKEIAEFPLRIIHEKL